MFQYIYIKKHRLEKALKIIKDNAIKHDIEEQETRYKIHVRGPYNKVSKLFELTI